MAIDIRDPSNPILIVDDNPQYTLVLSKMLKGGMGYEEITTATSPEEGYALVAERPDRFKLLFIDFRFPGGSTGTELMRKLDSEELMRGKVVFLITSEPTPDNVKAASKAGALGVVAKPFDRSQLEKQLEKAQRSLIIDSGGLF